MNKINSRAILFAMLGGIAFWLIDAVFDKFILFPHVSFWNIFLKDASSHSFYSRPLVILIFIVVSLMVSLFPKGLKSNKKSYSELLRNINEAILINPALTSNGTDKYVEVNDAACDLLGYTRDQLLQLCPRTIMGQNQAYDLSAYMEILQSQGNAQFETELVDKKGNKIPVEISAHVFQFKGEPTCLALVRDISAKVEIENALLKSEKQLHTLTQRLLNLQEEERGRLSRELHDELAQDLVFVKMELHSIQNGLPLELCGLKEKCASLLDLVEDTSENVRRLAQELRPRGLEEKGFSLSIYLLAKESCKVYGIDSCLIDIDQIDDLLSTDAQLNLYRIFQESLTNIGKHAGATDVAVIIKKQNGNIFNRIKDNGKGYDRTQTLAQNKGVGLSSIEERARLLNGALDIKTNGGGTEISLTIPLQGMASIIGG